MTERHPILMIKTLDIKMKIKTLILATSIMLAPLMTHADVLKVGHHTTVAKNITTPKRGNTMKSVRSRYGKAKRISRSKGRATAKHPRITRWEYGKFTVYFEKYRVLHTVVHLRRR